jgi:hypothetical protein
MDTDAITKEIPGYSLIPLVQRSALDPPQRVGLANTDAPYGMGEAEKKTINGRKLITALN